MKQFLRVTILEPLLQMVSSAIKACGGNDVVAEHTEAMQFVGKMANVDIWGFGQRNGMPYEECPEPDIGYQSSHCILMNAVISARWIRKSPPVKCGSCGFCECCPRVLTQCAVA